MKLGRWLSDLLGYPWIDRLEAISLQPRDLLIIHVAPGWKEQELDAMRDDLLPHLPDRVQVIVMVDDTRIEVLRVTDPLLDPDDALPPIDAALLRPKPDLPPAPYRAQENHDE